MTELRQGGEASSSEKQDFKFPQRSVPKLPKHGAAEIQLLQDELKRAKLDVLAYSTTITTLQHTLRAMEKTILELRGTESGSLTSTKSHQQQSHIHTDMQYSSNPSTDYMDCSVQKQECSSKNYTTLNHVTRETFNLTGTLTKESTKSMAATTCFEVSFAPDSPISLYKGTATSYLCRCYFSPSGSDRVFVYDHEAETWSELPQCLNTYFSLVTVNGLVTAIGGWVGGDRKRPTNALLSLLSNSLASPLSGDVDQESCPKAKRAKLDNDSCDSTCGDVSWREHFPAMPTKRGYPAAVYHNHSLIVAGGDTTWTPQGNFLTTVEVLDTTALQWYSVSSLPVPLRGSTAAVCADVHQPSGGILYLLGGWDKSGNSVYSCSIQRLLSTAVPHDPNVTPPTLTSAQCSCCWRSMPPAPFSDSSCVSIRNRLYVFGGRGWSGEGSDCVHTYHQHSDQWVRVGRMSVGRSHPLVTVLADDRRAVVVGGMTKGPHITDCSEIVQLL